MSSTTDAPILDVDNETSLNSTQEAPSSALHDDITSLPANEITPPNSHSKPCSLCDRPKDVLIRCQIDETKKWHFVCTGRCWQSVSGGSADGDKKHPLYRYGGIWKNKHDAVSGKIKGRAKEKNQERCNGTPGPHRRKRMKVLSKRTGKDSGLVGDMKIKDDDGGSDIEVSELSDEDGAEELLDGFEEVDEGNAEARKKEEVNGNGITSVKS
jgi:hypothetical protein